MAHARYDERRTSAILRFIATSLAERGYPPTRREILVAIGLKSPSDAQWMIEQMAKDGLIEIDAGVPRGLRITAAGMIANTEAM